MNRSWTLLIGLLMASCGGNSVTENDVPEPEYLSFQSLVTIDASSHESWVFLSLDEELSEVEGSWDIAVQRYRVKLNPKSEPFQVVARFLDEDLHGFEQAPEGVYFFDNITADKPIDDGLVFLAADAWYNYNPQNHILSPKTRSYIIRSGSGQFYALAIRGYYDQLGSPGMLSLELKRLAAPAEEITIQGLEVKE